LAIGDFGCKENRFTRRRGGAEENYGIEIVNCGGLLFMIKIILVGLFALLLSCMSGKENCLSKADYTTPGMPDTCDLYLPMIFVTSGQHLDIPSEKATVDFFY
jgi:hypothetical protein